jgi:hypothetical protein
MILIHGKIFAISCMIIQSIIVLSVIYAYQVNAKRTPDDPEKKEYSLLAILLIPIVWPFLMVLYILFLILSSILFGAFLILFTFALLLFRKPFLIKWILKQAESIGNDLLKINTALLRAIGLYSPPLKPSI